MMSCQQFEGMNVYEHGLDVHARYLDLHSHLLNIRTLNCSDTSQCPEPKLRWRMPEWVHESGWLERLLPLETMRLYQTFHDCGKPLCRTVDDQGRQHFVDHAAISYATWMQHAETAEDHQVGELILHDMDAHTVRGDAIDGFIAMPEAPSLLMTALAEIHSNAAFLGRLDSDGFKIKWKQLDRIGKRMVADF